MRRLLNDIKNNIDEIVLVSVVIILAILLRLFFILQSDFPVNDGGLFYVTINDLKENGYILPKYTSYNHLNIPYSYPPLAFYLTGFISDVFGIDVIQLLRFLPLFFNIVACIIFYDLSKIILKSSSQAFFALFAFSLLPPGYEWFIGGGGITRSLATVFLLIALQTTYLFIQSNNKKYLIMAVIFISLTGWCHLEILLICLLLIFTTIFHFRKSIHLIGVISYLLLGISILLLPYFYIQLIEFGFQPLLSATLSGEFEILNSIGKLFLSNTTSETIFTPFLVFGMFGLIIKVMRKDFILPIYILILMLFISRSFERTLIIPLSMLFGFGIDYLLPQDFLRSKIDSLNYKYDRFYLNLNRMGYIFIIYILMRSVITSAVFVYVPDYTMKILPLHEREVMGWIKENTNISDKFIVISDSPGWAGDFRSEWFPALTNRHCLNTVQGSEWLQKPEFSRRKEIHKNLNQCIYTGLVCINEIIDRYDLESNYIYLAGNYFEDESNRKAYYPLFYEIQISDEYELIYQKNDISIFLFLNPTDNKKKN